MENNDAWKYALDLAEHEHSLEEKQLEIINHYGFEAQIKQLDEELLELLLAIRKHRRYNDAFTLVDIAKEMADVLNLIEQFMLYLQGSFSECILTTKKYKINRELNRISQGYQNEGFEGKSKELDCKFEL